MAGSEQDGVDGADADLFVGAAWVLTPTADTDAERVHARCARSCAISAPRSSRSTPEHHDVLVALVSHVPQLAASTLMDVATTRRGRAPRAAAARGGRLPRHDADRGGPSRDLARHPHVEPRRGARRARRRTSTRCSDVRELVAAGDREACSRMLERARVGPPQPAGRHLAGRRARRAAHPGARPPGRARGGDHARRAARRQRRRLRDRALAARAAPVCSCSSSRPTGADGSRPACTSSATTSPNGALAVSEPAPTSSSFGGARPLRGPAAGAGRQVDLAPRAAVRRARRRAQHDHAISRPAPTSPRPARRSSSSASTITGSPDARHRHRRRASTALREPDGVLDCEQQRHHDARARRACSRAARSCRC